MAFKPLKSGNRKVALISLVDVAFILLLFFLVTSMITQLSVQEQKLSVPTPEKKRGRAQILVQVLNEDKFLYLDQSASAIVEKTKKKYEFNEAIAKEQIVKTLLTQRQYPKSEVLRKLETLQKEAKNNLQNTYFVLIRCPDELYYYHVIDIIEAVTGQPNIHYGCVSGTMGDIQSARSIKVVTERGLDGKQHENLVIEFGARSKG